jgi:hypothetical protein
MGINPEKGVAGGGHIMLTGGRECDPPGGWNKSFAFVVGVECAEVVIGEYRILTNHRRGIAVSDRAQRITEFLRRSQINKRENSVMVAVFRKMTISALHLLNDEARAVRLAFLTSSLILNVPRHDG